MPKLNLNIIFFLFPVIIFANDTSKIFQEANELYQSNEFSTAIEKYESIENQGFSSAELYYNLGNAYYKINKPGKAVLNYERALLIATAENRSDIEYNLELVRKSLIDEIEVLPQFFLKKWKNNIRRLTSSEGWSIIALLLFWLGIGGFVVWLKGKRRQQKKIGFVAGLAILIFSSVPFLMAIDSSNLEKDSGLAVIMANEVDLRSAPDEVSKSIFLLHEGTSVALLDQIGDWYKVKLLNGEEGWLPKKILEKV
jgi:tetratricopeptide (TPR) repeat protein